MTKSSALDAKCLKEGMQVITAALVGEVDEAPSAQDATKVCADKVGDVVEGVAVALGNFIAPQDESVVQNRAVALGYRRELVHQVRDLSRVPGSPGSERFPSLGVAVSRVAES